MLLIICALFIISFVVCRFYIRSKWNFYVQDRLFFLEIEMLRRYNILSGVWPDDDGFMSLVFSALRHTLIPLFFAFLIWFVNNDRLNSALLFLTLLYAVSILPRHEERKEDFKRNKERKTTQEMLKPVKSACFSVIVCAFINYIILLLCYGLRP